MSGALRGLANLNGIQIRTVPTYRQDKRAVAFRELVTAHGGTIEPLPEDAFKASGTSVRTVLITIRAEAA